MSNPFSMLSQAIVRFLTSKDNEKFKENISKMGKIWEITNHSDIIVKALDELAND